MLAPLAEDGEESRSTQLPGRSIFDIDINGLRDRSKRSRGDQPPSGSHPRPVTQPIPRLPGRSRGPRRLTGTPTERRRLVRLPGLSSRRRISDLFSNVSRDIENNISSPRWRWAVGHCLTWTGTATSTFWTSPCSRTASPGPCRNGGPQRFAFRRSGRAWRVGSLVNRFGVTLLGMRGSGLPTDSWQHRGPEPRVASLAFCLPPFSWRHG